jgi:L-ascorbate metabolism protein UlaG (beta-lactamase superfamily)
MADMDTGLNAWQMKTNHNRMINFQATAEKQSPTAEGAVELAFFGSSAFRITTPQGITVMVDPWRNHPSRRWDWYFHDFPITAVDVGVSTHAHFDHDALHRLDASVLLDRLIGSYTFSDLQIHGIAEKHAIDSCCAIYDFKKIHQHFHGVDITPPNNPRSWDHCLIVIETGGLRILHWGDNRADPPEEVWDWLGEIDIALLPVDNSQHVIGFGAVNSIIERLNPKVVVPHHYYIWDVVQRQSTLQVPSNWLDKYDDVTLIDGPKQSYSRESVQGLNRAIHFFGDNVAFDKQAWFENGK